MTDPVLTDSYLGQTDDERTTIREFEVAGPVRLVLEAHSGAASVDAGGAGRVRVEAYSDGGRDLLDRVRISLDGDVLRVTAPRAQRKWFTSSDDVSFRVVLPAGSAVDADTGSGELTLVGDLGELDLRSGSGEISVDSARSVRVRSASGDTRVGSVAGDCRLSTASGDVEVGDVGGRAQIESASGGVSLGAVALDAEVSSASGDIAIGEVGGEVKASSMSGDVTVRLIRGRRVQLTSASGDLAVGVPAGVAAWLDLTSASGSVRTDLEDADEPDRQTPVVEIRAVTASGDIRIRRA